MAKAASKNIARLNEDMKRELIDIIDKMRDPRLKAGLVTVTRVENVPDLSTCKVYVSVLNEADDKAAAGVVAALEQAKGHVRSEIAGRMHIRRAPQFTFLQDDSAAYADHINKVLRDLEG